jgi:acetaldehyde dehydrogenase
MRNTVFCAIEETFDRDRVRAAIQDMVQQVKTYVPGYRLVSAPMFGDERLQFPGWNSPTPLIRLAVSIEVEGAGDTLPAYAGNLDIITCAAVRLAQEIAVEREGTAA